LLESSEILLLQPKNLHICSFLGWSKSSSDDSNNFFFRLVEISPKIFDRKTIWPKHHLTEHRLTDCHLTESSFDRIAVRLNAVWPKFHLTERSYDRFVFRKWSFDRIYFRQTCHFIEKKLCTRSFERKFIWPKAFSENDHLTESSFDRKIFSKNGHLTERTLRV
jgi:hypothetical protein